MTEWRHSWTDIRLSSQNWIIDFDVVQMYAVKMRADERDAINDANRNEELKSSTSARQIEVEMKIQCTGSEEDDDSIDTWKETRRQIQGLRSSKDRQIRQIPRIVTGFDYEVRKHGRFNPETYWRWMKLEKICLVYFNECLLGVSGRRSERSPFWLCKVDARERQ